MAGRIRDEDIATVRERSPIADVVGEYLQLRNAGGGSLKGLCPFHDEKTPSFNVTPSRGLYYCFSCAEGGDVISFVQKVDSLTFTEAVERLAARAGLDLRYEQGGHVPGQEQSQRRRLISANAAAAKFYSARLREADAVPAREFLSSRGFDLDQAEQFGIGYAPDAWEALTGHLRSRGFTDAELLTAGLAKQGRRGPVDPFRGRLIWPIRDLTGDVIAFGARKLAENDNGPKYLNTPETPLFKKSSVLYGADLARREISHRRQVVIVEGYTDVMACHLAGVPTAVATSGTSFGEGHIRILRRLLMDASEFRGEVIFTFDGDAAGQRAALRAFAFEEKFVTQTFVTVQPDGLDPCDLRLARGDAAVRDLIAQRVPLHEFAIRNAMRQYNLDTVEGRVKALDAAAPIVAAIKDRGMRHQYAVQLDRWLGLMDETFVLARVRDHAEREQSTISRPHSAAPAGSGRQRNDPVPDRRAGSYNMDDPVVHVEREVLKLAVQRPALCGPEFASLAPDAFSVPAHAQLYGLISSLAGWSSETPAEAAYSEREWVRTLREAAPDDAAKALLTQFAVEPMHTSGTDGEADAKYASVQLARLEEISVSRRIHRVKSQLQRMDPTVAQPEYSRVFGDLLGLEQRRKVLLQRASGDF